MGKLDLMSGTQVLEEVDSPFNGRLTVLRDLGWGTHIRTNDLTQSGGIVEDVWKKSLKKIKGNGSTINSSLILGLGGGSVAKLIRKFWPISQITGVDIDPVIVGLGKKYLGLDKIKVETVIKDASKFVRSGRVRYDLICVDMYKGEEVPLEFNTLEFIREVKKLLKEDGIAIFNRLYGPSDRLLSMQFAKRLEDVFWKVEYIYPQANIMFVCYNI